MPDDKSPRLIPAGANNEHAAVSVLLSVLMHSPSLARALLADLGAPLEGGAVRVRVQEQLGDLSNRADGFIAIEDNGKLVWAAIIEAKVGRNPIRQDQVDRYFQAVSARSTKIDQFVTISNQVRGAVKPTGLRTNSRIKFDHISWTDVVSRASRVIKDPRTKGDEKWLIREMIHYFDRAGILETPSPPTALTRVLGKDAVKARGDGLVEVAQYLDEFLLYVSLKLSEESDREIVYAENEANIAECAQSGAPLSASFRQAGPARDFQVLIDLVEEECVCSVSIRIGGPGSDEERVAKGLAEIKMTGSVQVSSFARHMPNSPVQSVSLSVARGNPRRLLTTNGKSLQSLVVARSTPLIRTRTSSDGRRPTFGSRLEGDIGYFFRRTLGANGVS